MDQVGVWRKILCLSDQSDTFYYTGKYEEMGRVPVQGLHSSKDTFESQLCHNDVRRMWQFEGSSRCSLFSLFSYRYHPSQPPVSQDSLRARKRKKREEATSQGVDRHFLWPGHLVMQPGNDWRLDRRLTWPSKVSPKDLSLKAAKDESFEGCKPWITFLSLECLMFVGDFLFQ